MFKTTHATKLRLNRKVWWAHHWDRLLPPPGRTEHTWRVQAGHTDIRPGHSRDSSGLVWSCQGDTDSLSPELSTCPRHRATCAAPVGCSSGWGPPARPAPTGGSPRSTSHTITSSSPASSQSLKPSIGSSFEFPSQSTTSISLLMSTSMSFDCKIWRTLFPFQYHNGYGPITY